MNKDDLAVYRNAIEEFCYDMLTSTTKSADYSTEYYKMELAKRRATNQDFRIMASIFADIMSKELMKGKIINDKEKLTRDCLAKAWKKYNK